MTLSFSCNILKEEISREIVMSVQSCEGVVALHHASSAVQPEGYDIGMYSRNKSPEGILQLHLSAGWNGWPGQVKA